MKPERWKLFGGVLLSLALAVLFGVKSWPLFRDRKAPIVSGWIVERTPIKELGFRPSMDLTIRVEGSETMVHAVVGRQLDSRIPERVEFRFSGVPDRRVFLRGHEENPVWIFLFALGGLLFLA